ncbi:hypothetical protein EST38_g5577 [Candolleomyces aberdarensis]|uniref:ferric-chelate reductase (NADPH) n=1 Tax=Candolleomyces aberdarensis TaxID=2316362 RepID=A0A4Q2DK12_9AGAR|nr:hypothetical protein EST38_g5577 [Candolleomyces aberdarensis]
MSTYSSAPNATTSAPGATTAGGDHEMEEAITAAIVIQVNIFIFGLMGLVILLRFPQLVGVLRAKCGRPFLQLLGRGAVPPTLQQKIAKHGMTRSNSATRQPLEFPATTAWSEESHESVKREKITIFPELPPGGYSDKLCPPHVASAPSFLTPVISLLRRPVLPGLSAIQFGILMNYTYILLYGLFLCQLPLVFALAQKSSFLGTLLGYGYESLNYFHRYAGIVAVWTGNIHCVYYIFKWTNAGTFSTNIARSKNAWGLVLMVCMNMLWFFSTSSWRKKCYNIFLWTHTIAIVVLFPAPYALACVALYGVDRIMRLVKSRFATASVTHIPQLDLAYIQIPTINSGWRAGQHVRLRILSGGMGVFGWTESHPFTIASASGSNDGLVLLCKKAGDWTGRLVHLAKELSRDVEGQGKLNVWVEGPFGGPARTVFSSFSGALLVVGGSGISFGLSMVEELLGKDLKRESRIKYIELVWIVQDPEAATLFIPILTSLIQQSEFSMLRVSIHYTRALTKKVEILGRTEATPFAPVAVAHPNLTLTPGRPNLKRQLENVIDNAVGLGSGKDSLPPTGVSVGVCGPRSLADSVVQAVADVDSAAKYRAGGVEVHEEAFGW